MSIEMLHTSVLISYKWGFVWYYGEGWWWRKSREFWKRVRREASYPHGMMHSLSDVWVVLSYFSLSFMVWGTTKEERLRDDEVLEVVGGVDLSNRNNNEEYQSYFFLHYGYIYI